MSPHRERRSQNSFSTLPQEVRSAPKQESRSSRFRRQTRQSLARCLSFALVMFCVTNVSASWQLRRELAAVVARGEPLQLEALAPAPVPDRQNAADVYLQAAASLALTPEEEEKLSNNTGLESAAGMLARNQTAIHLVRQAAALPACRFPVDYAAANPAGILLPHLGKMRRLAEVMGVQALWEARRGQADAALADIAVLFRMSEHLAPEPILLSGLTALAIERVGYKALAQALQDVELSPTQAREYTQRLPRTDWVAVLHQDLLAERCFGVWAFQTVSNPLEARQLASGPSIPQPGLVSRGLGMLWSPLWKRDEIAYLHALDQQSAALLKPGTVLTSDEQFVQTLPWYAVCTRIMLPALARVAYKRDSVLVYRRMAWTALALNACRTIRGQYPDSLREAQAVWGVPLPPDLYTGQAFLYHSEGSKALLYSVGPNRRDDGGKKTENAGNEDDLVW